MALISAGDTPFATIRTMLNLRARHSTSVTLKFKYPSNLAPGSYFILASLDSTNVIAESNEENNVAVTPRQVTIELSSDNRRTSHRSQVGHVV